MTDQTISTELVPTRLKDRRSRSAGMSGAFFPEFGLFDWPDRSSKFISSYVVIHRTGKTGWPATHPTPPSRLSEEVADSFAKSVQEYLNTTVMGSARQLVFNDAVRLLREHNEAIAELTKQQSALMRQVRDVQKLDPSEAAEQVALWPFSDRIKRAIDVALDEAGVRGVADFDGNRLTLRIPRESEESLIEGGFEIYRVLARELPLKVFRALDIDTEILE